jgi:hypothetical protein
LPEDLCQKNHVVITGSEGSQLAVNTEFVYVDHKSNCIGH